MRPGQRSARGGGEARRRQAAAAAWTLAIPVVGSVLAIGAVHTPVLLAVSLCVLGAVAQCLHLRDRPARTPTPVFVLLALAAVCLLQTIPLPLAWLERISPTTADVWSRAFLPFGEPPPLRAPLSLDPSASLVQALAWATYAGVFHAAAAVSSRRGAAWGITLVFASASAAALTTLTHGLAGATQVFGLYTPQFPAAPWHVGPLLNPNNLAGYLDLGTFCGVGLYLMRRPLLPRWLVGAGIALLVAITITSASRAGLAVLPIGAALLVALLSRRTTRGQADVPAPRRALLGLALVALGGGAALAVLGSSSMIWLELGERDTSKLDLFRSILPMLRDYPWLGVGRGAFESVYPAYRAAPGNVVFTHAENFLLQWAAEWGLPIALAALLALVWALRPSRLGVPRSAAATGAWVGVVVLLLQNLADLALEVPAIPIAIATVLGSLWGDGRRRGAPARATSSDEWPTHALAWRRPASLIALGLAGLALATLVALRGGPDLDTDRASARASLTTWKPGQPLEPVLQHLREATLRHPADPYFPLLGASLAWQSERDNPIPWLQRTLERSQRNGRAHLLLADVLADRGARSQALLELRFAVEDDLELVSAAALRAIRWTRSWSELERAAPEGKQGAPLIAALARYLDRPGEEEQRLHAAREALRRDPGAIDPRWVLGDLLIGTLDGRPVGGLCEGAQRAGCGEDIEAHARAIEVASRRSFLAPDLRARWLMAEGRPAQAEQLLAEACNRVTERAPCLKLRVRAAALADLPPRLAAATRDLLGEACGPPTSCAQAATWLGDLMASRKAWGTSLAHYERAVVEEPTEARWEKLAESAIAAGSLVRAVEALDKVLRARGGHDPALEARITSLKARAAGNLLLTP
ncbi:O-antigen ligase family protein [Chondromyces crocatus]|uniref:LPS lipooligosaccharide O-antigen ligase n=1 Tax=Chondromyces crocatus TaxID=52 RepID=A0A0K1EAB4_CHOCO|nr:O-antigen ligase family protein [Chondromyces crocatus]AKT37523.1 LPS lipooligosaccharide O-antigen ligase [Chondromyces crocatus]